MDVATVFPESSSSRRSPDGKPEGDSLRHGLQRWRSSLDELAALRRKIRDLERREQETAALSEVPLSPVEERTFDSHVLAEDVRRGPGLQPADRSHVARAEDLSDSSRVPSFEHRPGWTRPILRLFWKISNGFHDLFFRPQRLWKVEMLRALQTLSDHVDRMGATTAQMADRAFENFENAQHRDMLVMNRMGSSREMLRAVERRLITRSELELARCEETLFHHRLRETSASLERFVRDLEPGAGSEAGAGVGGGVGTDGESGAARPGRELHDLDAGSVYLKFEDMFRGSEEEIRDRLRHHLEVVEQLLVADGSSSILDLGCGRGEWLELLEDAGFQPTGIDYNEACVERCRRGGLQVRRGDVFEELKKYEDGSLDCVTAFHLVEHMPMATWMDLLAEIERVLSGGGLLLLETPNPENLVVGGFTFWLDGTHERPIAPHVMVFALENLGFSGIDLHRLRGKPSLELPENEPSLHALEPLVEIYDRHFAIGLDYSVHCRKP